MPRFDPASLAQWTAGRWTAAPAAPLEGFGIDTRKLRRGEMFVALRTPVRDGHDFLEAAAAAGAGAALVSDPRPDCSLPQLVVDDPLHAFQSIALHHRRGFGGPVAGISGSAGKTSTKDLLAILLGPRTLATQGNLNNHLGVPLTLTRLDPTHHTFAVIEAGISAPGEMAPLARMIEPDVAVITLVDHAHTRDLGGLAGVAREKAVLPAAVRPNGVAVLPRAVADLPAFGNLPSRRLVIERADVILPENAGSGTLYFTLTQRAEETAVTVAYGDPPPETYALLRVTDGMAQNAVLAICVARWLGVTPEQIRERLDQWQSAALRGEVRHEGDRVLYVDCYNANPASMLDALATFDAMTAAAQPPRLFILGGMEELGEESDALHERVGVHLPLQHKDQALVIGTGAEHVATGAHRTRARPEQVEVLASLDGVAARVAAWPGPIFIKGSRRYRLETLLAEGAAVST